MVMQAIYEAMVRLAQDFAMRYPLVDGQGNFGNIDGDSAAAMRYTEARMSDVARMLLEGIDEDAVDFRVPMTVKVKNLSFCLRLSPICLPMGRRALLSAWRHRSRRIISLSLPMRSCI